MSDNRCGTYAGWNVHQRGGEEPCRPCKAAHAAYMRQRRAAVPGVRAADQWLNNTRRRALERLAAEYPIRFSKILAKIREEAQTG